MQISLSHTTETGHRIPGHKDGEGKCARLHGHHYRYEVRLSGSLLDENGFLVDFSDVKAVINEWDHRTLLWADDPLWVGDDLSGLPRDDIQERYGIVRVAFIPTAENMADELVHKLLDRFDTLWSAAVDVWETPTSCATASATTDDLRREQMAEKPEEGWPMRGHMVR